MKAILICPEERPAVASLGEAQPLALSLFLGKPLLHYWVEYLAGKGVKEIRILAADRPDQVRASVGEGARWGLQIEVTPELRELTVREARMKYFLQAPPGDCHDVMLVDSLPQARHLSPFKSYQDWLETKRHLFSQLRAGERLGMKETQPGIWIHFKSRVAAEAKLIAPVWIGENVFVGAEAIIGPMAVLEDEMVVERGAEIVESVVGSQTFVGELTRINHSIAFGGTLINWKTNSCTSVPDAFLLSPLSERPRPIRCSSLSGRIAAFLLMLLTAPFALMAIARAKLKGKQSLRSSVAVRPQKTNRPGPLQTFEFYELANVSGWGRRWPQLWNIVCGDFVWVGNRPLTTDEAALLTTEFERLWLEAPIGLISQADAEGCTEAFNDEARAHASFYTVQANWKLDVSILRRVLLTNRNFF